MRTFVVITLVLLAIPPALADCTPTTTEPEVSAAGFYVDNDYCPMCMFSIWVYQESNGIEGLQRADEVHDDTCGGMIDGDTIIF